jgi:zinc protease
MNALLLAAALATFPGARVSPPLHQERGADGLELVVQEIPGAPTVSVRVLVRAGGTDDPPGQDGLAHLVEHLVFEGDDGQAATSFRDAARAAGAVLNAHTSSSWTRFEMDLPSGAFEVIAPRWLRLVTNPAWDQASVGRARGVLTTEAEYHAEEGLLELFDRAVFPSPVQAGSLVGSRDSRERLTEDMARVFFSRHYRPDRTIIVVTGAATVSQARSLVADGYAIPPAPPEPAGPAQERPNVPLQERLQAGLTLTMLGYQLEPVDRRVCGDVAALLELRLRLTVQLAGPRVSEVSVRCPTLRGQGFLLAMAFTSTLDADDLPVQLQAAVRGLATRPADANERALVDSRLARLRGRLVADGPALADRLSELAAENPGRRASELMAALPQALPPAGRIAELVQRSCTADRRVMLSFSPMQN